MSRPFHLITFQDLNEVFANTSKMDDNQLCGSYCKNANLRQNSLPAQNMWLQQKMVISFAFHEQNLH